MTAKKNSYKSARGVLPWKPGDEPAEDTIARLRGRPKPRFQPLSLTKIFYRRLLNALGFKTPIHK